MSKVLSLSSHIVRYKGKLSNLSEKMDGKGTYRTFTRKTSIFLDRRTTHLCTLVSTHPQACTHSTPKACLFSPVQPPSCTPAVVSVPLGKHAHVCAHRHTRTHTLAPLLGISVCSSSLRAHLSLAACPVGTGRLRGLVNRDRLQTRVTRCPGTQP